MRLGIWRRHGFQHAVLARLWEASLHRSGGGDYQQGVVFYYMGKSKPRPQKTAGNYLLIHVLKQLHGHFKFGLATGFSTSAFPF